MILKLSKLEGRASIWKYIGDGELCEIEEGDRIKLGRVELYLKELRYIHSKLMVSKLRQELSTGDGRSIRSKVPVTDFPLKNSGYYEKYQSARMKGSDMFSVQHSEHPLGYSGVSGVSNSERSCRVCFDSRESKSDPLFNACLCTGTIKYIHFECLKNWFRSKTVKF